MPLSTSRLLLSMILVLATSPMQYVLWMIADIDLFWPEIAYTVAVAGALFVLHVLAWTLIWRREVNWSPSVLLWTGAIAVAGALGIVAVPFALLVWLQDEDMVEAALAPATALGSLATIGLLTVAWTRKAERAVGESGATRKAVPCPRCRYNLAGLSEARCPECGGRFTLEQLLDAPAPPAGR